MKHGFTVAIIALAPVFVAVQNQPSGAQDRQKTQQAIPAVPVSVNCNCTAQTENGKNKPQGWHKLVAWPEGVETWAILFTLGAIIWQAAEIRRSVNIATRTLVTTFRPRVSVRGIKMDPASGLFYDRRMDKRWKIDLHITNTGGTAAYIQQREVFFQMYSERGEPGEIFWSENIDKRIQLLPGGQYIWEGTFPGDKFRNSLRLIESSPQNESYKVRSRQGRLPICHGTISYRDDNGFERKTSFMREWKVESQRFAVVDDPEHEYQD
ncbi:MAG: hypothetical protein ABSE92_17200 [Terriglobales bacterium]|jgi:hypothetical protein